MKNCTCESSENYLETILMLQEKMQTVRAVDIATALEFSKASVSIAMKKLRENGSIVIEDNGFIVLTDKGRQTAETIYERHEILSKGLVMLGVSEEVALKDACRIEHVISPQSFEKIKKYMKAHDGQ